MGIMLQKTYEALRSAGASEEAAQEAAVELGSFWARLTRIEVVCSTSLAIQVAVLVKLLTL